MTLWQPEAPTERRTIVLPAGASRTAGRTDEPGETTGTRMIGELLDDVCKIAHSSFLERRASLTGRARTLLDCAPLISAKVLARPVKQGPRRAGDADAVVAP